MTPVTLRPCTEADGRALLRLAQRDSAAPLSSGAILAAERGGRLLAAICLREDRLIADPFEPTSDLVELLRLRAAQLRGEGRRSGFRARLTRPERRAAPPREAAPSARPGSAAA